MKKIILYLSLLSSLQIAQADSVPDKIALACTQKVTVSEITKTVVRMTPFRGVNLIFPEKLADDSTIYSLSSNAVWSFTKASGTRIVPITYKTKQNVFGEIQDLTIATEDHIYSIALVAEPDIKKHCTNVVFQFSAEEKQKRDLKRLKHVKNNSNKNIDSDNLDQAAQKLALKLVAEVALSEADQISLYEEKSLDLNSGSFVVYIDKLHVYKNFSVMTAELKNNTSEAIKISRMIVSNITSGVHKPMQGFLTKVSQVKPDEAIKVRFATSKDIKDLEKTFLVKTNKGNVTVQW